MKKNMTLYNFELDNMRVLHCSMLLRSHCTVRPLSCKPNVKFGVLRPSAPHSFQIGVGVYPEFLQKSGVRPCTTFVPCARLRACAHAYSYMYSTNDHLRNVCVMRIHAHVLLYSHVHRSKSCVREIPLVRDGARVLGHSVICTRARIS